MKINSAFYNEAIIAMNRLNFKKQILDRYEENIFYNRTFLQENEQVFVLILNLIMLQYHRFFKMTRLRLIMLDKRPTLKNVVSPAFKFKLSDWFFLLFSS